MMEFSQDIEISGIIVPHNWDETGRIIGIAIYTNAEEIYTVEHNSLTRELINLMHKIVEIEGKIREYPNGIISISAQKYTVLGDTDEKE